MFTQRTCCFKEKREISRLKQLFASNTLKEKKIVSRFFLLGNQWPYKLIQ